MTWLFLLLAFVAAVAAVTLAISVHPLFLLLLIVVLAALVMSAVYA